MTTTNTKPLSYFDYVANVKTRQVGGQPSSLDYYDKSARRIRRFYHRYFTGIGVGGGRIRILTLTSSDEAVKQKYDIHRHYRALVMRLRRRWGRYEYLGVKEKKGDRTHLHLVFRGKYMEQALISAMWADLHKSPVVDIRQVTRVKGGARYLAKYLAKATIDEETGELKYNRYWASYNWVFPGWVSWSQRVKRWVGFYPGKSILRVLAQVDPQRRVELQWFLCPVAMMPP